MPQGGHCSPGECNHQEMYTRTDMLSHEWELPRRHSQDGGAVLHISRCPEWAGLPQGSHTALVPNGPQRRKPSDMSYSDHTMGLRVILHSSQIYKHIHTTHLCTLHIGMHLYTYHTHVYIIHTCTYIYINFSNTWTHMYTCRSIHTYTT